MSLNNNNNSDKTNETGKWKGYGFVRIQRNANNSHNLHIPADVRNELDLQRSDNEKGKRCYVEANLKTNQIRYTVIEDDDK